MADAGAPVAQEAGPGGSRPWAVRAVAAFGHFWWDFLVGDTPELLVGGVGVIGLVALACLDHHLRTVGAFLLPVLVAVVLTGSVWWAARRGRT